jgi:hypothetical protein
MIVAFDLETYYTKKYSVTTIGLDRYVKHPDFKVTLVSIVAEDGFEWVGKPQDMPADRLNGHTLISHNAEFDSVCARAAITKGPRYIRNYLIRNYRKMPVSRWRDYPLKIFRRILILSITL